MSTVTYTVPNISCAHCVHTIQSELSEVPGVKTVQVDLNTKKVVVSFDSPVTHESLVKLLTEIDYPPVN